jgi:2-polyprenyl-3-methyl-5-hydroxy-6-metoxy-1,4-benzoquinol methylase
MNCLICQSNRIKQLSEQLVLDKKFQILICDNCGTIFTWPRPDQKEINIYYGNIYYSYNELSKNNKSKLSNFRYRMRKIFYKRFYSINLISPAELILYWIFKNRYGPLSQKFKPGKILDIGCGDGFFLSCLKDLGWQVKGIEIDEKSAQFANQQGLNVFAGILEQANLPDNFFDVIRLSHTLEHVYNPKETLKEIYRILKPNGSVIIKVPNFNSIALKFYPKGLEIPRHLFHFNIENLKKLLHDTGFHNIKIKFYSVGILHAHGPKFFNKPLFIPIFLLIDRILDIFRLGDSLNIAAKK